MTIHCLTFETFLIFKGGPMVTEGPTGSMEVIGIVSWGRGCAR